MFANITDTFALVRFRQAVAADFSSKFADNFVISTGNGDLRSARAFDGDTSRSIEFEGMEDCLEGIAIGLENLRRYLS